MRRAERVVFAFGPLGEARQAAALADGADTLAATGQDLVRIALMTDVPDQAVVGRVEDIMEGDRQFDDAQPRAQMAAGGADGRDRLGPQFVGELPQLLGGQATKVVGGVHRVEQRGLRNVCHLTGLSQQNDGVDCHCSSHRH